ncbi:DUF4907 domain-containing protein [Crocinitomicaceae bacterium]|nr:DUF4907 domain-containing protein [Crocinitomicaceae bacterium]
MKSIVLFSLTLLLFSCSENNETNTKEPVAQKGKPMSETANDWSYRAVQIENKGWGYQLYEGARMKINQQNIPAINGLHYFESEEKAEMAAKLALEKVAEGFFPPTVNPEELDSIGAINLDSLILVNEELSK